MNEDKDLWVAPTVIILVLVGLVWWGISASIKYVDHDLQLQEVPGEE